MKRYKLVSLFVILHLAFVTALFGQVDTAWVRIYNGSGNFIDMPYSIAVDGQSNVYVTGGSYRYSLDYATIKYNSNGDTVWVRRYGSSVLFQHILDKSVKIDFTLLGLCSN
jgi:hypothetical protein